MLGGVRTLPEKLGSLVLYVAYTARTLGNLTSLKVYNASNNELVRTNTLVKSAIVQVDATPFRQWYEQHVGVYFFFVFSIFMAK